MGRHEAADGAATHPLVADALHRRPQDAPQGLHDADRLPGREGPVGWPAPGPDEGGEPVGWPAGTSPTEGNAASARAGELRGWRRLLGRMSAA